eukprot:590938_1
MEASNTETLHGNDIDTILDEIENKEKRVVDWKLIRNKVYEAKDDNFIINMLMNDELLVTDLDEEDDHMSILHHACSYGMGKLVRICVHLGADIKLKDDKGLTPLYWARAHHYYEIAEYLLLESIGGAQADKIVNTARFIWNENSIINAFRNRLEDAKYNEFKQTLLQIINEMVSGRDPISSFLVNLAMSIDSVKTWDNISTIIEKIVHNTEDKIGWHYLNYYLVSDNSFLFKEYALKHVDNDAKANDDTPERDIKDLNPTELIYVLEKKVVGAFNEYYKAHNDDHDSDEEMIGSDELKMMKIAIQSEKVDGKRFAAMTFSDMYSFFQTNGVEEGISAEFAEFFTDKWASIKKGSTYKVPHIYEPEYGYYKIYDVVAEESLKQAEKMIKGTLEMEEKNNLDDWMFIVSYPSYPLKYNDSNTRLRQDSLQNGVQSKYSSKEIVKKMTSDVTFNAIKFYDISLYLSELVLQCGFINDLFQRDIKSIFEGKAGVRWKAGPLKTMERCKVKTETEYNHEDFPQSSCLLDIIRCSVVFDDLSLMIQQIKVFEEEVGSNKYCVKEILRVKNGFATYSHDKPEYIDIKFNVRVVQNGVHIVGEVQFLINEMAIFKVKAHKYYSILREKETFDDLKLVSALKNNINKQLRVHGTNGNHKEIMNIIINERAKNLTELQQLDGFLDFVDLLYENDAVDVLRIVLSLAADENEKKEFIAKDSKGNGFSLELACQHGSLGTLKYLLSVRCDEAFIFQSNAMNSYDPFTTACRWDRLECIRYLYGQLPSDEVKLKMLTVKKKEFNDTGLMEATEFGNIRVIKFILKELERLKGKEYCIEHIFETADTNQQETAFMRAAEQGSYYDIVSDKAVKMLELYWSYVDEEYKIKMILKTNKKKRSMLMKACDQGNTNAARLLLDQLKDGAQRLQYLNAKDAHGDTARDYAEEEDHHDLVAKIDEWMTEFKS